MSKKTKKVRFWGPGGGSGGRSKYTVIRAGKYKSPMSRRYIYVAVIGSGTPRDPPKPGFWGLWGLLGVFGHF